jgi:hypothetical protein
VTDLSSIPGPEFVSWNRFARRMVISLTASAVLTIGVVVLGLGIDVNRPSGHRLEEFLDNLIGPGFKIGEWLVPGHDLISFGLVDRLYNRLQRDGDLDNTFGGGVASHENLSVSESRTELRHPRTLINHSGGPADVQAPFRGVH